MINSDPNLPPNHHRVPHTVIAVIFPLIGTIIVSVRLYVRGMVRKSLGWDDYTIFIGWVAAIACTVASALSIKYGIGLFAEEVDAVNVQKALHATFYAELTYCLAINSVKISILFCYTRISTALKDNLHIPTQIVMAVVTVQFITIVILVFLQCRPISNFWRPTSTGSCFDIKAFYYSLNVFTIISDLVVLALPIPYLSKVHSTTLQKFALCGVFLIGALSTTASCVRLYTISVFTDSHDPIYDAAPINYWSLIEMNLGLACACGPALNVLITRSGQRLASHSAPDDPNLSTRMLSTC